MSIRGIVSLQPPENRAVHASLSALSYFYGAVVDLRNWLYDRHFLPTYHSPLPVVCVGNLVAGGSGKTPLVLALAAALKARGHTPVILSRGFGGRLRGPHLVGDSDSVECVGDEPLLMARRGLCAVVIARDRVSGTRFIEGMGCATVILLDDGFQHRRLGRICNLACFFAGSDEAIEAIVKGSLLPVGRFREDRSAGLRRADGVVFSDRGGRMTDEMLSLAGKVIPPSLPVYHVRAQAEPPIRGGEFLAPGPVWLLSAIANPDGFRQAMEGAGYPVIGESRFPDHHQFSPAELQSVIGAAKMDNGAECSIVCTEKDWVKLATDVRDTVWVAKLSVYIPHELISMIDSKIAAHRLQSPLA